ncbi:MAG TPA: hypothetical protein VML54_15285 [Candidatus Limnocylindrales bacterium]|nr:hypothetical protein [Candidatus Limnocylindrales bacterium]
MRRARFLGRLGIMMALLGTVAVGASGCVLVPVPGPFGGPFIGAPRHPVVVVPGPRHGHRGYGGHGGYGGYRRGDGGWR